MRMKNRSQKKRIKQEYNKQFKYLCCCNDACKKDETASNVFDDNISRAKELFCVVTDLIGDFIHVFFFLLFSFTSFAFFNQQKVFSISSFQESLNVCSSTIW